MSARILLVTGSRALEGSASEEAAKAILHAVAGAFRPSVVVAGDTVLDPFGGSGTVGMVANWLGRGSILCELNPEYVALIEERVRTLRVPANDVADDDRQLRLLG